jgi:hypothetical protein
MNTKSIVRLATASTLLLLPALASAEVSVNVDRQGKVRRVFVLTRGTGPGRVIWSQVRPYLRPELLLNPLGDTYGDLAPVIRQDPRTGNPLAVWSANVANVKQLRFSFWTGRGWSTPGPVVTEADPYLHDQLDPSLAFDGSGTPYLVWSSGGALGRIYFSTYLRDRSVWSRPLAVSAEAEDSRGPSISITGTDAVITYQTPAGTGRVVTSAASLIESAEKLMDTPTPPGNADGAPDDNQSGGDSGNGRSIH